MTFCDAVLEWRHPDGGLEGFVTCEKDEHTGVHQALNFEWNGEGLTTAAPEMLYRGRNAFFARIRSSLEEQ